MLNLRIRASMLPGWNDCQRRSAAKQYRRQIEAQGFDLRSNKPTIGAAVGTSVHEAFAIAFTAKKDFCEIPKNSQLVEAAVEKLKKEAATGMEWDDTTPNLGVASTQISRMVSMCVDSILPVYTPYRVEYEAIVSAGDGFEFSGKLDLLTLDGILIDLKTGAVVRPYQAQLGGYSLLQKHEKKETGEAFSVREIQTIFVKRSPKYKAQDSPVVSEYNLQTCEMAAWHSIESIKSCMTSFLKSPDPWTFAANPMSMMCRPQFCPAHGTNFCKMGV
ncbi:MAG: hypothetical protein HQL75_00490 [Magnetococcales bacterium]|nr:hypothetical protein [Magnetococcales bacterium]